MRHLKHPVLLGKIGAPHGVRGEVRVTSFTQDPQALGDYGPLTTADGRSLTLTKSRPAKNVLVASFKEIKSREDAENHRGVELFIERDSLPENTQEDEFYIGDLVGMLVVDGDNNPLGKILDVPNFGAGDLLEISPALANGKYGTNTWFLAFTRENVPDIDIAQKIIRVEMPKQISERDKDAKQDAGQS